MSTILKSLKRLEKEKGGVQGGYDRPLLTPLGVPQLEMERAVKLTWLRAGLFRWGVAALVVAVGAAGLYAYTRTGTAHHKIDPQAANSVRRAPVRQRPETPPVPSTSKPQPAAKRSQPPAQQFIPPVPPEGAMHPLAARKFNLPPLPEDEVRSGRPARPQMPPPDSAPRSAPMGMKVPQSDLAKLREYVLSQPTDSEIPAMDDTPADMPHLPPALAGKQRRPVTKPSRQDTLDPAEAQSSRPSQGAQQENTIYTNAERMTDGRLKVQAIVWSETPEDRMAVVNNRTVREGGTIDGFAVVEIGEEAIFVREDGMRLLKVPFGGP